MHAMEYYFRLTSIPMSRRRGSDVIASVTMMLLSVMLGVDRSSASAEETRLRCEDMTFVSLDAVGMSERPCWSVCPPVKSLPMHTRFCQRNCPEYFQECVSIPNVGRNVGGSATGSGQEASGLEGHVTMKVFVTVSVVLAVIIVIVVIVTAMAVKCCVNNIISKHCRCKQSQQQHHHHHSVPELTSKDDYVNDEACTLMIRPTNPPGYVHQNDDVVKYKHWNHENQPPEIENSSTKATDSTVDSGRNVTTSVEVHSADRNSNTVSQ